MFSLHFSTWICPESNLQVMNVETESILLRRMEFFLQYNIEVWLRKEVSLFLLTSSITINCFIWCEVFKLFLFSGSVFPCSQALSVNTDEKTVIFDDGSVQSYDQLLIATGCRCRLWGFRLDLSIQSALVILFNQCFNCESFIWGD